MFLHYEQIAEAASAIPFFPYHYAAQGSVIAGGPQAYIDRLTQIQNLTIPQWMIKAGLIKLDV